MLPRYFYLIHCRYHLNLFVLLSSLFSQTGFKNLKQLAPAQFFLNKPNGSNVTMDFYSVEQSKMRGGEYICALLLLQPTNHSRGWDMNSCSIERLSDPSAFRCHCSHQGTVVLLYAERDSTVRALISSYFLNDIDNYVYSLPC